MSSERNACEEALTALFRGEHHRGIAIIVTCCRDERIAFSWACGYSAGIGACVPGAVSGDRIVTEVDQLPGFPIDPAVADLAELAGPFIAAACNDDIRGAQLLWANQTIEDRARLVVFLAELCALAFRAKAGL